MAHLLENIELQAKVQVLNFQCLSILCLLESHNDMDLQHNHLGAENIIITIVRVWKLQAHIWYEHMNTQHMHNNWELGFATNTQQINIAKLQAICPRENSQMHTKTFAKPEEILWAKNLTPMKKCDIDSNLKTCHYINSIDIHHCEETQMFTLPFCHYL